ncbi:7SK snRNA methylphosphate capping enzyme isoform X2 [Theropithecus gelada]|uniref:7SK snRNA methylphosphate capping enzyme isoform X2 n=1 Tax=Theropithecus gelada TaxID=9565 RepID=UPI000DC15FF3|nr:7SK snRNA methylphosphate capping enzyme isoform X2 [Theropithecus gelada]
MSTALRREALPLRIALTHAAFTKLKEATSQALPLRREAGRHLQHVLPVPAQARKGVRRRCPLGGGRRRGGEVVGFRAGWRPLRLIPQEQGSGVKETFSHQVPSPPTGPSGSLSAPPAASVTSAPPSSSSRHRKRRRTSSKSEAGARGGGQGSKEKGRGSWGGRHHHHHPLPAAGFKKQQRKFQYGNYCKYYGYRNPSCEDGRLRVLKPEWFRGRDVLDLGCNVGHLTLSIACKWGPSRMVGLDIDSRLIHSARQNIRHYLSEELRLPPQTVEGDPGAEGEEGTTTVRKRSCFPASLTASRGPIAAPQVPLDGADTSVFPNNVVFVTGNYVLDRDDLVEAQTPEYDVVLCLSLTKWVHLNWGDEGLKRMFRRIYRHLRPGGILVLEPQPWSSYGKRKTLTETIYKNYYRIQLKPEQFSSYLTSPDVGFSSYELVATPHNTSKGFQRPVYLFHKARSPSH